MSDDRLGILEQRRIEAAFAKGIYEEMKAELGEATAKRILSNAVVKLARQTAAEMAKEGPGGQPSLEHFIALQPLWTKGDALRIETLRKDATHYDFNVTRCHYAEMYRQFGDKFKDIRHEKQNQSWIYGDHSFAPGIQKDKNHWVGNKLNEKVGAP